MNVGVLFGGNSVEHEVSIITANQAMKQCMKNVIPLYVSKDLRIYTGTELLEMENYQNLEELIKKLTEVRFVKEGNKTFVKANSFWKRQQMEIDVVLMCMHGSFGEMGVMQGMLDFFQIPYTSSTVLGSSIGQDKVVMKDILKANNFEVIDYISIYETDDYCAKIKDFGLPVIIKPATLGSSVGIQIIRDEAEIIEKCLEAFQYERKVIVERFVNSFREVNVSVIGYHDYEVSEIEEVFMDDELLSYKDKYERNKKSSKGAGMANLSRVIPADLNSELVLKIEKLALKAARVLNTCGVVRFDLMIVDDCVYITEVNNIPGSLSFYLWEAKGLKFADLLDRLLVDAIARHRDYENKLTSYETNILSNYHGSKGVKK